jgi:2-dehydro-3-deoxyglucarate aldolase
MNSLKQNLAQGKLTIGSWISLAHPAIAEIMARAGFEWLVIDLEHSVITIREAEELIRTINLCGATPLVRLTVNDSNQIKRVMDAGAHGIIVPMVKSQAEAEKAVGAVYYPPRGQRGVGLARAQGYGVRFREYCEWLAEEAVVIAQIEHIQAVEELEAILSVSGIDGYIIGPYDLSASMGLPGQFDDPQVEQAVARIKQIGAAMKKPGGLHVVEPDPRQMRKYIDEGFRFLAYSVDTRMLDTICRTGLKQIGND